MRCTQGSWYRMGDSTGGRDANQVAYLEIYIYTCYHLHSLYITWSCKKIVSTVTNLPGDLARRQAKIFPTSNAFPNYYVNVTFFVLNPTLASGTVCAIYCFNNYRWINHFSVFNYRQLPYTITIHNYHLMHFFVLNTAFLMYILCSKLVVFVMYIYVLSSAFIIYNLIM